MTDYNSKVISKVDEDLYNINQEDLDRKVWKINNDGDGIRRGQGHTHACYY